MPIISKRYEVTYQGESKGEALRHPELKLYRRYMVSIDEKRGQYAVTILSRIDLENDQIVFRGSLGIPVRYYELVEELARDWKLAEPPYDWQV